MERMQIPFPALVAVVVSFALAGCGSTDSGGQASSETTDPVATSVSADSRVDSVDDLVELMSPTVECDIVDDAPDGQAPYTSCPVADGLELSPVVFPTAEDRLQDPETFYGPNSNNSGACTQLDPQATDAADPAEGFYYVASDNWHIYLPMFQESGAEEALQVMANLATTLNAELTFCED